MTEQPQPLPTGFDRNRYKRVSDALKLLREAGSPISRSIFYDWLRDKKLASFSNELEGVIYIDMQELWEKIRLRPIP